VATTLPGVGCTDPAAGSALIANVAVWAGTPTADTSRVPSPTMPSDTGWGPSSFHSWYSWPAGSGGRSSTNT